MQRGGDDQGTAAHKWSDDQWQAAGWDDHSWGRQSQWWWDPVWSQSWRRRPSWGASWTTASASASSGGKDDLGGDQDYGDSGSSGRGRDEPDPPPEGGRGPSERMIVPSFSGEGDGDELGTTARSYIRQIQAWRKMTRVGSDKQALVLYQHLTGPAWVEAERLDMEQLGSRQGLEYYIQWVRDRYLDVQVTQIGRALSDFFRRLRKKPGQSIRDYCGEFDRAHARLLECGCVLPDIACAWVFIDRMNLDEAAELNLLSSVNNLYDLKLLQRAAIVQDRALRKPWDSSTGSSTGTRRQPGWWKRNSNSVHYTELDADQDLEDAIEAKDSLDEDDAEELYESYMTHVSAKQKYKEQIRMRGSDPESIKKLAAEKLQMVKEPQEELPVHMAVRELQGEADRAKNLQAITDTACSKSVAGVPWVEAYVGAARNVGYEPEIINTRDAFKFGASRIFEATYAIIVNFGLGNSLVRIKVCVVNGDVPLLLSRSALGGLGMVLDVEENSAEFRKVGVHALQLEVTATGHPALPVQPEPLPQGAATFKASGDSELQIIPRSSQYTAFMAFCLDSEVASDDQSVRAVQQQPTLFFPKKIGSATRNMLLEDQFCVQSFIAWWEGTSLTPEVGLQPKVNISKLFSRLLVKFAALGALHARITMCFSLNMNCGGMTNNVHHTLHFGSVEPFSLGSPCTSPALPRLCSLSTNMAPKTNGLLTAPTKVKSLWDLNKTELVNEATTRGLWVNPRWTVPEIRSIIQEDMNARSPPQHPDAAITGISRMTHAELSSSANSLGIAVPENATKGTIMRLIRDHAGGGTQLVMSFGRYKGYLYSEVPIGYRRWAINEVLTNENHSEELRQFSNWCKANMENVSTPARYTDPDDPELVARTPYVPESSEGNHSWELLARAPWNAPAATPKAKTRASTIRRTPPSATSSERGYRRMEAEVDAEVLDEIQHLETRLAII
ncbi:GIP, partial [Symbiodinium sp. CCMP2456]